MIGGNMKLRQQQITRVEQILNDLERKVEEMEERVFNSYNSKDYITYDLGKDLENISFMLDMLRKEIKDE
tara:strand:- start:36 stop:245 length:210 start_codon:yes stop_codon:yes gene_type:complete